MTTLDDASAIYILRTIAQPRLQSSLTATPDFYEVLARVFGGPSTIPASKGDLARAALDVLLQDAEFAEPIRIMAKQAPNHSPAEPERYSDLATGIAVTTAAVVVLQTQIEFKVDQSGKWSLKFVKRPASDGALKLLVQRLLSLLPG